MIQLKETALVETPFAQAADRTTAKELLESLRTSLNAGYQKVEREKRLRVPLTERS